MCFGHEFGMAVVGGDKLCTVGSGFAHLLHLRLDRCDAVLMQYCGFGGSWTHVYAMWTAVVGDIVDHLHVCDVVVVDVMNDSSIHVVHRAVVLNRAFVPITTLVTSAAV